jgi:hypothetical protein
MILTGENRSIGRKTRIIVSLYITVLKWTDLGSNASLSSQRPLDLDKPQLYLNIQLVPRSKHSSLRKTNQLMLFREINYCRV